MQLEAKETRLVIQGLNKLLDDMKCQLEALDEDDDEYSFIINDMVLIDSLIKGYEEDYQCRFDH